MKRNKAIEILDQMINTSLPDEHKFTQDELSTLLGGIESELGMRPPSVTGEDVQALLHLYVAPNFYQWEENLEKDEKLQETKRRRAEAAIKRLNSIKERKKNV